MLTCGGDGDSDRDWTMYLLVGVMEIVIETGSCTYLWG